LRLAALGGLSAIGVGTVGVVMLVWGESLLVAAIVFAVKTLGLWPGYAVFCLGWGAMGLVSLAIYDRALPIVHPLIMRWWRQLWPTRKAGAGEASTRSRAEPSLLARLVMRAARVSRPLGVLVAAALIGGPGTPVWRLLGFRGGSGYVCVVLSTAVFGIIWVPFYGLGGGALWDLAVG
jgi:hypothetical protein